MDQDEQVVRELVREAVAQRLGVRPQDPRSAYRSVVMHPSHAVYLHLVNDTDACVIEPAVACTHCNYCKSHGH